jgi:hypothetical protein
VNRDETATQIGAKAQRAQKKAVPGKDGFEWGW